MKKTKTLKITFESWDSFKGRVKSALNHKKSSVTTKSSLVFSSVVEYQKFMTEQKIAILAAIINYAPSSIYELAQIVERDFANVQRDCTGLVGMGFIKYVNSQSSRKSKTPELSFNYTRILVVMPKISYSHDLIEAA